MNEKLIWLKVAIASYSNIKRFMDMLRKRGIFITQDIIDGELHIGVKVSDYTEVLRLAAQNGICFT